MVLFIMCGVLCGTAETYAQKKKPAKAKPQPKAVAPETPPVEKPKDTVIVEQKAEPKKPVSFADPSMMREKVIVITKNPKPKPVVTYKDTVIIVKKGLSKEQLAERRKTMLIEEMKNNNYCNCVKMDIKVANTLEYSTYLNYEFIFKNDCKMDVWISSKHFRFVPLNAFDQPVRVLRKLSFVQRYGVADFEKLAPGESHTFSYSDDAFFEYDLKKGENYKFIFEHRNFGDRVKSAPEKTYLCSQKRTQVITVK